MSTIDDLQAIDDHDDDSFLFNKEMELSSPPNGFQELNDILTENEPCGLGEPHPDSNVNKEQNSEEYAFGDIATTNIDDFPYYELCASPQQTFSPLHVGFGENAVLSDVQLVNDNDVDDGRLCSDYLSTSSFQVEVESIRNNTDAEVSGQIMDSSLKVDVIEEQEMRDVPIDNLLFSVEVNELMNNDLLRTDEKSPDKSLEVPKSHDPASLQTSSSPPEIHQQLHFSEINTPATDQDNPSKSLEVRISHDLASLETSSSPPDIHQRPHFSEVNTPATDQHNPNKSLEVPKSHDVASLETSSSPKDIHQQPHSSEVNTPVDEKNHASMNISSEGEQHTHDASARNHHSHRDHQRRKRSVSKSPSRRKEAPSRHRRDHRERSRSRSPPRREYYKRSRSPRRRYAPSHRSSPSSYNSRYRSPKQRQWSPPRNRNTGIGKPGKNLFIAGFSFLTTERDLERKFSRFGRARDVRIVRDKRSGESRGFGFLTLERDEEADAAIRALDKTEWNGRVILVEKSKPNS